MDLDRLGLDAIVSSPDKPGWLDEPPPPAHIRRALRQAVLWLNEGMPAPALGELLKIREAELDACQSYDMRRLYYLAAAYLDLAGNVPDSLTKNGLLKARAALKQANAVAVSGKDVLSQVTLCLLLGDVYHDLQQYERALDEYMTAKSTLDRFPPRSPQRHTLALSRLNRYIGRQHYLIGNYSLALDYIAMAREVRAEQGEEIVSAADLTAEDWIKAMVIRAESQRAGGDPGLLKDAMDHFELALKRLRLVPDSPIGLARLLIQVASTHLDIAALNRREDKYAVFREQMELAQRAAIEASDMLRHTKDESGKSMVRLVVLRYDHLDKRASDLPASIYDEERKAVELDDLPLLAQAATLRADVLASKHDLTAAAAVYYVAIDAYEHGGARGEAARAIYGLRRVLDII